MQANERNITETADLALIRAAAREAGRIAMRYFRREQEVWMKGGASPVSTADFAVDDFLRRELLAARPDYGWLSEETKDNPERLAARKTFVVDPIDGTRAFLEGLRTWCVSIAVVEDGATIAGVLDCPAKGESYEAASEEEARLNGAAIRVKRPDASLRIGGPKTILNKAPAHMTAGEKVPYIPSLAYRIAMVAKGELDATFVKPNSHDWDLAAADLILFNAGGTILEPNGNRPVYAGPDPRHGPLAAGSGKLVHEMANVIAAL